jgi:hypothetical protein
VAITGMNLEGVANYFLDHADFTQSEPLTPAESAELGKIIFPTGKMTLEFYNTFAKSDVYDVSLTGTMQVDPKNSDHPEADVTIKAKDVDKTVQFLQKNANTVPQFGQASFMLLMMKGFGKPDADGSMVWNVKLTPDGTVTINGQPMKM